MPDRIQEKTYRTLLLERQGRRFSESEVTKILQQVLPQLAQIHIQGQAHGSISLDSLVQRDDRAVLVNTNPFLSDRLTISEDFYSLGIAIIELLTAKAPHEVQNLDGSWNLEDYCTLSDRFADVLNRMVAKQPQNRFTSAKEVWSTLAGSTTRPGMGNVQNAHPIKQTLQPETKPNNSPQKPSHFHQLETKPDNLPQKRSRFPPWLWVLSGVPIGGLLIAIALFFSVKQAENTEQAENIEQAENTEQSENTDSANSPAPPLQDSLENPFFSVSFPQQSCGDGMPSDPNAYPVSFYPVFVEYSESNLELIKSQFCVDAYQMMRQDIGIQAIQVGSFADWERANLFQDFLLNTIENVEIGEPRIFQNPPSSISSQEAPLQTSVETERVSFRAGTSGAMIRGAVSPNLNKHYLLNCRRGQQFTLNIMQGDINAAVISPSGETIATLTNGEVYWQGLLPSTGDYKIRLSSPNTSEYAVSVEVL